MIVYIEYIGILPLYACAPQAIYILSIQFYAPARGQVKNENQMMRIYMLCNIWA